MQKRILVLVGLIGSGKTTLAKQLEQVGYHYVDFDHEWFDTEIRLKREEQAKYLATRPHIVAKSPEEIADPVNVIKSITALQHQLIVVDGWYTWWPKWWETVDDNTLQQLRTMSGAAVTVKYLRISEECAMDEFLKKHTTGQYNVVGGILADVDAYRESIPARMAYLDQKVTEWAK